MPKQRSSADTQKRFGWTKGDIVIEKVGTSDDSTKSKKKKKKNKLKDFLEAKVKGSSASGNWGKGGLATLGLRDDEPLIRRRIAAAKKKKDKGKNKETE